MKQTSTAFPTEKLLVVGLTLLAFALRVWQLASVPPGWRDDELINVLVISQKVLDGDWQFYYADASGNEGFYHALNAITYALFGANFLGIRLVAAIWGTTAVPLTWLVGRKLFGSTVGLLAAAVLTVSFWSLMYSRFGLRQIVTPTLLLLVVYFFWRGLAGRCWRAHGATAVPIADGSWSSYLWAGFWLAFGFYVYFAGRGVPLILVAFCGYGFWVARPWVRRHLLPLLALFLLTAVLVVPLFYNIQQQPEAEARVGELAGPLLAARQGDFSLIQEHIIVTLNMFHSDGDGEWLYNIPGRPIFHPMIALFMWVGLLITLYYALLPFVRWLQARPGSPTAVPLQASDGRSLPAAFLLLWWLAGISPGFISVPPASLGHTILAQPATYLLLALPIAHLKQWLPRWSLAALGFGLFVAVAARDLPAYFVDWSQSSMVRFLYRADLAELASYINQQPQTLTDFSVGGMLDGPWDRLALASDLEDTTAVTPRWYHLERAMFLRPSLTFSGVPDVPMAYSHLLRPLAQQPPTTHYTVAQVADEQPEAPFVCFQNGLCAISATYDATTGVLELGWSVARPLILPPFQLISNPPPPNVYAGPRLAAFAHLLDADGRVLAGDDGFWVDPYNLHVGDRFLQQHWLSWPPDQTPTAFAFGLYDPLTGERILTDDGNDAIVQTVGE